MAISIPPKGNGDKLLGANFAPLSVSSQSTPNMSVAVRAGGFWTADGEYIEFGGGNAPITSSTSNEWALVYIAINGTVVVSQQTALLGLPSISSDELPIAAVYVQANAITITDNFIFDVRPTFVAQSDIVVGGINAALSDRYTTAATDNKLSGKADINGTVDALFEIGKGNAATNKDIVAGTGTIRYTGTQWELDNGTGFSPIGTVAPVWGTITGTLSAQTDLQSVLTLKSDVGHTHVEADITDLQPFLLNITGESIHSLADVNSGSIPPVPGDVLTRNATNTQWEPAILPDHNIALWGKITGLLTDQVDLQTVLNIKADKIVGAAPGNLVSVDVNGVLLDSGYSVISFEPANPAILAHIGITSGNPHGTDLADLASVVFTGAVIGEVLTFNGSKWVNQVAPGNAPVWGTITGTLSTQLDLQTALTAKADVASVYTKAELDVSIPAPGAKVDTVVGTSGNIVVFGANNTISDVAVVATSLAPLSSPIFINNPTAPTPVSADNSTSIATTAFVQSEVGVATQSAINLKANAIKAVNDKAVAYTLTPTDANNYVRVNATAVITIDINATQSIPVGTEIKVVQAVGATTIVFPTTVTVNGIAPGGAGIVLNSNGVGTYREVTLYQSAADIWVAYGDIASIA